MLAHKPVVIRTLLLLFVFGVLPCPCPAEDLKKPKTPTPREQVLAMEKKLFGAFVDRDLAALDELLSEKLTFGHANGKTQTKQELMNAVETGEVRFRHLESNNPEVIPIKDAAIVSGTASIDFHNDSPHRYKRLKYLALFVKEDNQWRLMTRQPTKAKRHSPSLNTKSSAETTDAPNKLHINEAALEFADRMSGVLHVKTCYSKLFNQWYLLLYLRKDDRLTMEQYVWKDPAKEWEFYYTVDNLAEDKLEHHLKSEVLDEICYILK